jgi:glycosyltransferase involved in cell wall biosynthesis
MKIGIFCDEYPPRHHGGIGTFTHAFAHAAVAAGHSVRVVEFGRQAGERSDGPVRIDTLPRVRFFKGSFVLDRLRLRRFIDDEAEQGRLDIFELPEFQGMLPWRTRVCPTVLRLNLSSVSIARFEGRRAHLSIRWCERRTLKVHRNWIGASQFVIDLTRADFGLTPARSTVIYNPAPEGPSPDLTPPPEAPDQYVLFVGTLSERKGVITLSKAAKLFLPKYPGLRLVFLGAEVTVENEPSSAAILRTVGPELADRVIFPGRQPHNRVAPWIAGARLVAVPSQLEAFSIVPLEVLKCGVPMVYSTDAFGPEAVSDGATGLLADPRSPEDVSRCIQRLLDDPALAARLGAAGRAEVERRFTTARCVTDTLAFYEQVLREEVRGRAGGAGTPEVCEEHS